MTGRGPVEVVRELAGVMPFRRAVGGYVITSGTFTEPAEEFARGRGIKLINGKWLESMLTQARASLDAKRQGRASVMPIPPPPSWRLCAQAVRVAWFFARRRKVPTRARTFGGARPIQCSGARGTCSKQARKQWISCPPTHAVQGCQGLPFCRDGLRGLARRLVVEPPRS